jgi:ABC-type sugar transport system ATPase subunit
VSVGVAILEVRGLRIRKGGEDLLDIPTLAIAPGETLSLIGPNGAGKSTLLLALSGIEQSTAGELRFRGERVPSGTASLGYRRRIAMVFQEPLLFDTTVFENVASGLRLRGVAREEIGRRVGESLERFRIGHLADRSARTLSGGEAQRTSLARAMAVAPEILLLDEPFAALDPQSREELLEDLARTLRETGTTTVFVTHDRAEAQRLADRIAMIERGRLRQVGSVGEVLRRPADATVAAFVGVENLLPVTIRSAVTTKGMLAGLGEASLAIGGAAPGMTSGSEGLLCIRPEDIELTASGRQTIPPSNCLQGRIISLVPLGPLSKVTVDCGVRIIAAVSGHVTRELALEPGASVTAALRPSDLYVIPRG